MTQDLLRLENRIAQVERRTDRLEQRYGEIIDWMLKIDARITSLSRELGSKFAELLGAIDSVSRRSKIISRNYSDEDCEEITGVTDSTELQRKAREQREIIRHTRKLTRVLTMLIPAMSVLGAALWELLRFLLR